jgi:endoglucanase
VVARGFLRRQGEQIVDGEGRPVRWRGVAFGNQVWSGRALPMDHDETDFARVRAMGMNAVRFYFHYATLEDDHAPGAFKSAGWQWLDRNVAWARRHGVYLILNLHVPPGGYQSNGGGAALWERAALQDRLVALWRAIAERYADETIIAGYDILNEPCVPKARAEWRELAGRIARAIRTVDRRHIIIVERVNAVAGQWKNDDDMNFVTIDDPNVVYTFHFYDPLTYTHQFASWVNMGEGGRWPDETRVGRSEYADWRTIATVDSAHLPAGDSPWTHLETRPLRAEAPRGGVGHISLVGSRLGQGRVAFDDLVIMEQDQRGTRVGEGVPLDLKGLAGWSLVSGDAHGRAAEVGDGHDGLGALTIEGTTGEATLGSLQHEFPLHPGHSYTLSGWIRGEHVPPDAAVHLRLESLDSGGQNLGWTRAFLRDVLGRYIAWGHAHGVPLFLGEFGVHRPCFQADRGGLAWIEDVLDVADEHGLPFTYHDYHSDTFGLYLGDGPVDPAHANGELLQLFTRRMAAP